MAEKSLPITFDYKTIVTAMIKEQGLHEGMWQLYVEFGIVAANMGFRDDANPNSPLGPEDGLPEFILPTAIIPIKKIGLVKTEVATNLSVDAAKVNPKTAARKSQKKG